MFTWGPGAPRAEGEACLFDPYFTCGPDGDPYWDNVVLMLHFDGADGDTTFTDSSSSPKTVTRDGSVTALSSTQFKFGGTAVRPSTSVDSSQNHGLRVAANTDFNFGTDPHTIECWAYMPSGGTFTKRLFNTTGALAGHGYEFQTTPSSSPNSVVGYTTSSGGTSTAAFNVPLNAWFHVALVRNGASLSIFIDGLLAVSATSFMGGNINSGAHDIFIGKLVTSGQWHGWIDDLRITKGIARYTGNFTLPKAAYPDQRSSNIQASLQQDPGTTGWVASQPTRLTHKVVVTPFISSSWCAARVRTNAFAGKRYVEFKILGPGEDVSAGSAVGTCVGLHDATESQLYNNPVGTAQVAFSTVGFDHSGASIGYVVNGSSGIGSSAYAHATGDVIRLAFDQLTGGMWYAKNGGAWIGGGDPAAGTSPTHTLTRRQLVPYVTYYHRNLAGTSEVQIVLDPAELQYSVPAGFSTWGDANWQDEARTVLLVHADEVSPVDYACHQEKTLALTGSATVSTAQTKFGLSSILVPNTGSSTLNGLVCTDHQDLEFGTQDFTIELWAYRLANTYTGYLLWFTHSGGDFSVRVTTGGTLTIVYRSSGGTTTQATAVSFPLTAWNHCALQRRGSNFEFWLNGTLADTVAVPGGAGSTVNSAGDLFFGRQSTSAATTWNGHLDEIRITRGNARYTATFSPPNRPFCPLELDE